MDVAHTEPITAEATEDEQEVAAQIQDSADTEAAAGQVEARGAKRSTRQAGKRDRVYHRGSSRDSGDDADIDELASGQDDRDDDNSTVHVKDEETSVISIKDEENSATSIKDEENSVISINDSDDERSFIYVKGSDEEESIKDSDYKMSDDDRGGAQPKSGTGRSASGTRSRASVNSPRQRSWNGVPGFPQEKATDVNVSVRISSRHDREAETAADYHTRKPRNSQYQPFMGAPGPK